MRAISRRPGTTLPPRALWEAVVNLGSVHGWCLVPFSRPSLTAGPITPRFRITSAHHWSRVSERPVELKTSLLGNLTAPRSTRRMPACRTPTRSRRIRYRIVHPHVHAQPDASPRATAPRAYGSEQPDAIPIGVAADPTACPWDGQMGEPSSAAGSRDPYRVGSRVPRRSPNHRRMRNAKSPDRPFPHPVAMASG